ncbi:hypothetical protein FF1_022535 [Malus domestica]
MGKDLAKFLKKYGIKQHMSTPQYPWGNGQTEVSNKTIIDCIKKSISEKKGKWPDELGVLWVYHTSKKRVTGETPFSLAYGFEVIILANIMVLSINIIFPNL